MSHSGPSFLNIKCPGARAVVLYRTTNMSRSANFDQLAVLWIADDTDTGTLRRFLPYIKDYRHFTLFIWDSPLLAPTLSFFSDSEGLWGRREVLSCPDCRHLRPS